MNRDETIALWKRSDEARADALKGGASEDVADAAAAVIWNSWARDMISRRQRLNREGTWSSSRGDWGVFKPESEAAILWRSDAWVDLSGLKFVRGDLNNDIQAADRSGVLVSCLNQDISFRGFMFPAGVSLEESVFVETVKSEGALFDGEVVGQRARFQDGAHFSGCHFKWMLDFAYAEFLGWTEFSGSYFEERTRFSGTIFETVADFSQCRFPKIREISFRRASFKQSAYFRNAYFRGGPTDFRGASAEHSFEMTGSKFDELPWFNQASFTEAPDLDRVEYPTPSFFSFLAVWYKRLTWNQPERIEKGGRLTKRTNELDGPKPFVRTSFEQGFDQFNAYLPKLSGYRAIRRLAIQGHDHENESKAFKGEVRSKRGTTDLPWYPSFWFGILYDILSDFGRSILRPFLFWALCIVIFAIYFLGQSPEMTAKRRELHSGGFMGQAIAYTIVAFKATGQAPLPACISEEVETYNWPKRFSVDGSGTGFTGLVDQVRNQTNLVNEALSIAYHNAVIVLDSSGDSAHRAFGCLYGVERYGGNPVAYVPRNVAIASGIQKLLSAIFIFLFGLAVRNMLKVK
jgi:hypothetical protein